MRRTLLVIALVLAVPASATAQSAEPSGGCPPPVTPTDLMSVGDQAQIGGIYIRLDQVETTDGVSEAAPPTAGEAYYSFLITTEGVGSESEVMGIFTLNVAGFQYDKACCVKEPELPDSLTPLPGEIVRGWVTFAAPVAPEVTLSYKRFGELERVRWLVATP